MKIALYSSKIEVEHIDIYQRLLKVANRKGIVIEIFENVCKELSKSFDLGLFSNSKSVQTISNDIDVLLSIGGDGTFIDAAILASKLDIPIAGINCGRLGFLADINSENVEDAINQLIIGKYAIEKRSMLEFVEPSGIFGDFPYAINELTMHKLDNSSMIKIETFIDGDFLATYWADGLIVATPTGSTAYSLSVGGPIVMPNLEGLIITPIASHHLTVRPVVVPDNVEFTAIIEGRGCQFMVSCDHRSVPLNFSTPLKIRKAPFKVSVIRLQGQSFYSTLRNKLMWAADKRNN